MLDGIELHIKGISINWDKISRGSYLREIDAISGIDDLSFHKPITFFVGENGSGKSTLLEAIAVVYGFNPEGGTKNYNFSTYDSHSELCDAIRLVKGIHKPGWGYFLRAEVMLRSIVEYLKAEYDYKYIIIDCMPSLGMFTINAMACSDSVLIPVQVAYLPVKGLAEISA